jgi:hypothetical protein
VHQEWDLVIRNLEPFFEGPDDLLASQEAHLNGPMSVAVSLALAYQAVGRPDLAIPYIEVEQRVLDLVTDAGTVDGWFNSRYRSNVLALKGEFGSATSELEKLIQWGHIDPRILLHPVYIDIRETARFRALEAQRLEHVNEQRELLGLPPLSS